MSPALLGFSFPPVRKQFSPTLGLWSWDCQGWSALRTPSRRTESKVLGPQWQSQSQKELDKKAGTAIGKLKAREFREPSRGNLRPGRKLFVAGSLLVKEMLRALPALISTLERGHGGDHSKDKKGGSCYPYIMLEKKIQRAVTNSPWCILASSPGPKILGGERNILQTSNISECKELLNFQRNILYLQVNVFLTNYV